MAEDLQRLEEMGLTLRGAADEIERLRVALQGLALTHHRTVTPSKKHDPENVEWMDCTTGSCVLARIALEENLEVKRGNLGGDPI